MTARGAVERIPDKLYFRIGEVGRITGLAPHVLRFWETEFPSIRPEKSKTNQRVYDRRAIETILLIKHLLYEERFTIEGARARLKELKRDKQELAAELTKATATEPKTMLVEIRDELAALSRSLRE
ncbi:MAG: MerR family transcriptional regulator [Myxococcales bacterium]|nr:MAG: MerR family transcriptional regulator [Myxococcales bacterium]